MNKGATESIKFGDLLVQLELITEAVLADSLKVAPQFGLPLGRTLVLSGFLTEAELQLTIELQSLINQNRCTIDVAKRVAKKVRGEGMSATEAILACGVPVSVTSGGSTLGSILLSAGAVSEEQLEIARKISYESGMRLGRALVLNKAITHATLTKALELQHLLREQKITQKQAVDLLTQSIPKEELQTVVREAHDLRPAPARKQVRFGEFLVLCGLATESEILNAMETSLNQQKSFGDAIVEMGLISEKIFSSAIETYRKVCEGEVPLGEATEKIHKLIFGAVDSNKQRSVALGELLKITGLVNDADISEAISLSNKYPSLIGKMLVVSGAIDEATLIASLRCQYLLKYGYINLEDAVKCLQYTKDHRVSFDDAQDELGMRKPS